MEKPRLAISFSGGRSSAVMTKLCLEKYNDTHEIVVAFANTGCEHPATLDFVRDCDKHWGFNTVWLEAVVSPVDGEGIRHKVVDYESASRNGEPFEAIIQVYGIPNQVNKYCSRALKKQVIDRYLKSIGWQSGKKQNYQVAIGIRADEIDRISETADKQGYIYPLVDAGITKGYVNTFMDQQPFDLKIPNDALGNCVWCWKKSDRKLFTLAKTHPWVFDFPAKMEERYATVRSHYPSGEPYKATGDDGKRHFFRGHRDTADIKRQAAELTQMVLYTDQTQITVFDALLDVGGACSDGCEIGHD